MRWIFLIAMVLVPAVALALPDFANVLFISCHDGDTCTFRVSGDATPVRFAGIDAPEIGGRAKCSKEQKLAKAAKQYLEWHLSRAKRIDLVDVKPGLNRLRARVIVDGKDLSTMALVKGRVREYHGGKRGGWCGTS